MFNWWIDKDLKDHKSFVGLFQVDDITVDSLTHAISIALTYIDWIRSLQLSWSVQFLLLFLNVNFTTWLKAWP